MRKKNHNSTENSVKTGEIICKIDVLAELKKNGYNTSRIRNEKIIAECTLTELRKGIIRKMETLAIICSITGLSVSDIIEFKYTENSANEEVEFHSSESECTENNVIEKEAELQTSESKNTKISVEESILIASHFEKEQEHKRIPIEILNLSIKTFNVLKRCGINNLNDFFTSSRDVMRKLPKYVFTEINFVLAERTDLQYVNVTKWNSCEEMEPRGAYLYYCLWDDGHVDQRTYDNGNHK